MSEYQGLLQDVVENPKDDVPRLILADWLEDNGTRDWEKARSEFIRLQIDLHNYGSEELTLAVEPFVYSRDLLRNHGRDWLQRECPILLQETWEDPDDYRPTFQCDWERGFVWRVTCSVEDWLTHGGREAVKTAPITYVADSGGRTPHLLRGVMEDNQLYGWYRVQQYDEMHCLPKEIWPLLLDFEKGEKWAGRQYRSVGDAHQARSDALLKWANQSAS